MKKISAILEKSLANILIFLMIAIVLDVTWQVLIRLILDLIEQIPETFHALKSALAWFFASLPTSFTEELARFLLMWIGLLGAAYAYGKRSHLSLDLLLQSVNKPKQQMLVRIADAFGFLFASVVMVYGGIQLMTLTLSLNQTSATLEIPVGYVYACIPISGLLICWFALDNFIDQAELDHHTEEEDQ